MAVTIRMVMNLGVGSRTGVRVCVVDDWRHSGTRGVCSGNWGIDNLPVVVAAWNSTSRDFGQRAIGVGNVVLCRKHLDVDDRKDAVEDIMGVDFSRDDFLGDVMDLGAYYLVYNRWLPSVLCEVDDQPGQLTWELLHGSLGVLGVGQVSDPLE